MPYTDTHDVGKYVAAALLEPAKFGGQEIDLGSELLTIKEVRDLLVRISGRNVTAVHRTEAELEEMGINVFGQMFHLWPNTKDLSFIPIVANDTQTKFGISFTPVEEALQRDRDLLLMCFPGN